MKDDLMTALVERTDAEPWPPLATDGAQIRRRGRRRRLQQRAVYVGGTGLVATAIVAGPLAVSSWRGDAGPGSASSGIAMSRTTDEINEIFGVSVVLPVGWDAQPFDSPDGQLHACLGPSPLDPRDCAAVFSVAADPEDAYDTGLNAMTDSRASTQCQTPDPHFLTLTSEVVDDRNAHLWTVQCTPNGPSSSNIWALDNRTLEVAPTSRDWDDAAHNIFEHARTPADWPHRDTTWGQGEPTFTITLYLDLDVDR